MKFSLLLIVSMVVSLFFRALCFRQLIYKTVKNPSLVELTALCITGSGLNILIPFRAGDIFRAYYTGEKYNADKVKIFGSVMFERILDCAVIFLLLFFAILKFNHSDIALKLCIFTLVLIILGIIFVITAYKLNKTDEICCFINSKMKFLPFNILITKCINFVNKFCDSLFKGFEIIDSPKNLIKCLIFSFGIWFFECMNYLIVLYGFGYNIHWSASIFVVCFIALACMIPSASVFIGPYQLAVISAFAIYNIPKESALAISITEQSIVSVVTFIISAIFLFKINIKLNEIKKTLN